MPTELPLPSVITREKMSSVLARWTMDPPITACLIDIDGFAEINREFGRDAGDQVLNIVWQNLQEMLTIENRGKIAAARTGGDEFVLFMPASPERVLIGIEDIRRSIVSNDLELEGQKISISISAGVASWPQHADEPDQLFQVADEALQRAKREGRDRIAMYVEDKMVLKSNYYTKAQLSRLSAMSKKLERSEASILREALSKFLESRSDLV